MRVNPERIIALLAEEAQGGEVRCLRELWLVFRVAYDGGRAKWKHLIREYARAYYGDELEEGEIDEEKALELARQKLERTFKKLERLGILRKRKIRLTYKGPYEVYVEFPPSVRALLLPFCQ